MKYDLNKMMGLDMYLESLSESEYKAVSRKISRTTHVRAPLLSWDIYSECYFNKLEESHRLNDIIKVKSYAKKWRWEDDLDDVFYKKAFEAIIITDLSQKIVWVNRGFSKMTGYFKKEALNNTPRMLQGDATSFVTKRNIGKALENHMPFTEIITNYKKNGTPYKCEVKIFPLHSNGKKTHFMALERQVG